ncbi:LOW QUALITY PROTEIN: cytochrome P450 [Bipolaris maydis]|nr:LOW QUALITY PROTEIN: cytochrome P450 [Bipolaris maydis]
MSIYFLGSESRNLFLNSLRPKLWAVSQIPFSTSGRSHKRLLELHLDFSYPEAWEDEDNGKDPDFWRGEDVFTLVGSNRERHSRLSMIISYRFSAQAMVDQQYIFQKYASLLLDKLHKACALDPPFRCLDEMRYHPWVKLIFMYTKGIAISTAIIRFPFANTLIQLMTQYPVHRDMEAHHDFTVAQVAERMAHKNPRPDFIEPMIRAHEENEVTMTEIHANAHNLIVGGSEKTATRLSDVTYLLATHRDNLQKMYEELKATFKHEDEIKVVSLNKLEYMFAVLHKGLRISPAVPGMIPRKTPPEGIQIGREFVPGNFCTIVGVWQYPMFHNRNYFRDPELFVPKQWTGNERYQNDRRQACQSFAVRPLNCIGKNLADAEVRLVMARLVWNFDLEIDPQSKHWMEQNRVHFLWQKPELFIRLIPRKWETMV